MPLFQSLYDFPFFRGISVKSCWGVWSEGR